MRNILWNKTIAIGIICLFFGAGITIVFPEHGVINVSADPVWYTGWTYRKEIDINHFKVDANLTNFPVLINFLSETNLSAHAQPDGDDILFTDADGNKLSHEIELFNSTTGRLVAWVNVPSLSYKTDTRLYLYYGNATCGNQQDQSGTWNSDYLMVHHMNETGDIFDSTIHGLDAVNSGTTVDSNGKIDGCRYFNAIADEYDFGHPSALNPGSNSWTISLWTKTSYVDGAYVMGKGSSSTGFFMEMHTDSYLGYNYFQVGDGTNTAYRYWDTSWSDGNWHYITIVINRDSDEIDLYLDGALHNGNGGGDLTGIGSITTSADFFLKGGNNARHDEFTISTTVRNASWIKTCYNNQNDPSRFLNLDTSPEGIPSNDTYSPIRKYLTTQKIVWSFDDYWINLNDYPPHKGFNLSQYIITNYNGYVQINSPFIPAWIGAYYENEIRNYSVVPEFSNYSDGFKQNHIDKSLSFFNSNHITVSAHAWNHTKAEDLNNATLDYAYKIINFTLWNWNNNYHIKPHFWLGTGSQGNYNISRALKRFSDTYWTVYVESFTLLNTITEKFPDGKYPAVQYIGNGFDPEFGLNTSGSSKTLKEAQQKFNTSVLDDDVIFIIGHPSILNDTGQAANLTLWKQFIDWIYQKHTLLNINHTEAIEYNVDKNNFTVIRNNAKNYTIDLTHCQFNHNVFLNSPDNDESLWKLHDHSGTYVGEIIGSGFLSLEKNHYYYLTAGTEVENLPPVFGTSTPANSSIENPLSLTWSIPINDPNGNTFSWTIQCSNKQSNSGIGASNGTKSLTLSGLAYTTTYKVWVNATDPTGSGLYTRHWFTFTTKASTPPVFGTPSPVNGSVGNPLSLSWSIPITDEESFNWSIQCSNGQKANGNYVTTGIKSLALSGLAYLKIYTVWVNATDPTGTKNYTRHWFTFTTKANTPPIYGTPTPANNSIKGLLNLSWSILINDMEGDKFNWTIECSNGQKSNGSNTTSGTKSLALSNLTYLTNYTVWVNATDQAGSGLYNRSWFTFKTKNIPPEQGISTPTNGSTGNSRTLSWSIQISDEEHFNWTIQCSNRQKANGSNATSGTKSLALSGLAFSTTYTVWVNATDPSPPGSGNWTNRSYRFTTAASGGGGGGTQPSENQKPIADLSAGEPYQGLVNTVITFDGSKSKDPDGTITTWFWVFGDNTNGTGKTVTHTYSKAGTYTVTLTVTDNKSATNTDTTTCVITQPNRTPTPPIITGSTKGTKNTIYTYTAVSTDADNDTIKYTFNWGDSLSLPQSSGFLPNGTSFITNHSWAAAGRYNVKVTVTDNHTTSSSNITVYIDAIQTGDIGYLIDNNGDGIYDEFYSDALKQITTVQEKNGNYYIDSDGDGDFDYTYSTTNGLTEYQAPLKPSGGIEPVYLIGIIIAIVVICGIVLILLRRNNKV